MLTTVAWIGVVIRAFDLFLDPSCKLNGEMAQAVNDDVILYQHPKPSTACFVCVIRLDFGLLIAFSVPLVLCA